MKIQNNKELRDEDSLQNDNVMDTLLQNDDPMFQTLNNPSNAMQETIHVQPSLENYQLKRTI